jgi:hypothetical protein
MSMRLLPMKRSQGGLMRPNGSGGFECSWGPFSRCVHLIGRMREGLARCLSLAKLVDRCVGRRVSSSEPSRAGVAKQSGELFLGEVFFGLRA